MPATAACPEKSVVEQYFLGRVPSGERGPLEEHLTGCTACLKTLHGLRPSDPLLRTLGGIGTDVTVQDPPVIRDLVGRVERLRTAASDSATSAADRTQALDPVPAGTVPVARGATVPLFTPPQQHGEMGRIARYRILKRLGAGGMGAVYLAEDVDLQRPVALKVMLPEAAAKQGAAQRFLREARLTASIKHDQIVTIHQVGEERGIPYLAMELLAGSSLEDWLAAHPQPNMATILRIGRDISKGLAAAHDKGLIHRDIKPANVWLEAPDDRVKILDFGLARAATQESNLTQQGAILGTPAYMSPEQARGETVDARCDLWSLGVVLYRMSTGRVPFDAGETIATLVAVALNDPVPPAEVNPNIPPGLSDLVMRLLHKDPARRPGSARAVMNTLEALQGGPPVPGAPAVPIPPALPETVTFTVRRKSRKALWIGLAAAALVGLVAGIVLLWPTPRGTVRIEINDPAIEVAFDKNGPVFKGADKHEIRASAGEHGLVIKRGDLKFETDKFVLRKGETVTLKVEWFEDGKVQVVQGDRVMWQREPARKTVKPQPKVVPVAEVGVLDYAEIHDADTKRFDEWIAQLQKDGYYHPVSLSIRDANGSPRHTAVAIKEEKKRVWQFERDDSFTADYVDGWWNKDYVAVVQTVYGDQGKNWEAIVWVWNPKGSNQGIWTGTKEFAQEHLDAARTDKVRLLSHTIRRAEATTHSVLFGEEGGPPWLNETDQTLDECKTWIEKHKADGWRPDHLCAYGSGAMTLFSSVLVQDPKGPEWDVSWALTPTQYEAELVARKRNGFRPYSAVAHDNDEGALRYSVVWIRYRAVPEEPRTK